MYDFFFFFQFSSKTEDLLSGASICRIYGISAEDLLWKIQSINFTSSGPRSELRSITMDTLSEAKRLLQQDLTNAISKKPKVKLQTGMATAVINRSKLPNQKLAPKVPAITKQEQPPESSFTIAPLGFVITSNVNFIGPPSDLESKKKRKCEITIDSLGLGSKFLQTIICTRRYLNEVKVCSCFLSFNLSSILNSS